MHYSRITTFNGVWAGILSTPARSRIFSLCDAIRIYYKLSLTIKDKQLKKKLVEDGYEQVKLALQNGNHISSIHKWYGILLNEKSQYGSSDEQVRCAYEVLDHFEEACRLNPRDPTACYCLGSW